MQVLLIGRTGCSLGFSESTAVSTLVVAHASNQFTEQVNVSPQEFLSCANESPEANATATTDMKRKVNDLISALPQAPLPS